MPRTLLIACSVLVGTGPWILAGCADQKPSDPEPSDAAIGADSSELLRPGESEGSPRTFPSEPAGRSVDSRESASARILFLGTSLTQGLGLSVPAEEAWPVQVGEMLSEGSRPVEIVNAGLSGETSAGALSRLEWVLRQTPDVLVIETGANDGLRGLPVDRLEANLDSLVARSLRLRPEMSVVLAGMEAPPNMGEQYVSAFREIYARVARRHAVALIPFLLEGVAGDPELNQGDGVHPTADGHRIMARKSLPVLDSVVGGVVAREAASSGAP